MNSRALLLSSLCLALVFGIGCNTPASMTEPDAASSDSGSAVDAGHDAGPRRLGYASSADFPVPIAHAQGLVLPFAGRRYLYIVGGADAAGTTIGPFYSAVYRAEVIGDGTLGPWIESGDIGDPGAALALAGHDVIPLNGDDGSPGVAVAGGGTSMSALPVVLGGYVQMDGSLGHWGRFDPMLSEGQSFGSFDAFESHQLALIGGLAGATPVDRVMIAAIMNGAMAPTWRPGPSLPEARFGHASFTFNGDVVLIGGEGVDGPIADIIRTQRDATMEVTAWTSVGTIDSAPTFGGAFVHMGQVWVLGGLSGGRAAGNVTARVLRADIGADGHIGTFSRVAGGDLPVALAASAVVYDNPYVYLVGGLTGDPVAASTHVIVGSLP
jgi:hypothetical protein